MIIKCRTDNDQKYQKINGITYAISTVVLPLHTSFISLPDRRSLYTQPAKRNKRKCRIFLKTFPDQHVSCKHCCQNICPDKEIQHIPNPRYTPVTAIIRLSPYPKASCVNLLIRRNTPPTSAPVTISTSGIFHENIQDLPKESHLPQ